MLKQCCCMQEDEPGRCCCQLWSFVSFSVPFQSVRLSVGFYCFRCWLRACVQSREVHWSSGYPHNLAVGWGRASPSAGLLASYPAKTQRTVFYKQWTQIGDYTFLPNLCLWGKNNVFNNELFITILVLVVLEKQWVTFETAANWHAFTSAGN